MIYFSAHEYLVVETHFIEDTILSPSNHLAPLSKIIWPYLYWPISGLTITLLVCVFVFTNA